MNDFTTLARFEMLRWRRGRGLFAILVAFAFSALTGPIFAAYTEEILGALQTSDNLSIVVDDPTWRSGSVSYLDGAAQIALAFCLFTVASACSLGSEPLRIYYRTRGRNRAQVFLPRLAVSSVAVLVAALVGALVAWYEIVLLFDDVRHGRLWSAIALQAVAIVVLGLLAGLGAILTNAPGPSALVVFFAAFVVDVIGGANTVLAWSPVALLRPYEVLDGAGASSFARPVIGSCVLVAVAALFTLHRPLRLVAHTSPSEMRNHVPS